MGVQQTTARAGAMLVLVAAVAVYALREGAAVLAPLCVGVLLAYALEPVVILLMRARLTRLGAAALVYLILAVLGGSLARTTTDHVDQFVADLPNAIAEAQRLWAAARTAGPSPVTRVQSAAAEVAGAIAAEPAAAARDVVRVVPVTPRIDLRAYVRKWTASAVVAGGRALLIALITFLIVCTGDLIKHKLVALGGTHFEERRLTVAVIRAIDRQIERYLVARLLISVIVAVATGIGLWITGLAHPFAWGVIAGVLNVLPFIGPIAAVALIAGAAFLQFEALGPTLAATAVAGAVAALEGNVITPTLTSRAGDINTVAVFLSVLVFGWLWGVWGLVLAVPITVAVKAAADHIEPLQPIGELLGR